MGLNLHGHVDCISCMIQKYDGIADRYYKTKKEKYEFMRKVMELILASKSHKTAPYISAKINALLNENFGIDDPYFDEKEYFNKAILALKPEVKSKLEQSSEPLKEHLKYAAAGNIIDFGALKNITDELVFSTIEDVLKQDVDEETFSDFESDLQNAKTLVYLGDNCGEIVFDSLLVEYLAKTYPHLKIYFGVRGKPILNDVLKKDALLVGIDNWAEIAENGTAIPGTDLEEVSPEYRKLVESADIIISKGQGNFETLSNCGLNIYYVFLCKCERIVKALDKEMFSLMFINEQKI